MQFVTNQGRPSAVARGAKWMGIGIVGVLALIGLVKVIQADPPSSAAPAIATSQASSSATPALSEVAAQDAAAASSSAKADRSAETGVDYLALKDASERQLDAKLTDTDGVRYQNVFTSITTLDGGAIVAFCGEENNRTPFGGYGGFRRFLASQTAATTEDDLAPADFDKAWRQFCTGVAGPKVWF